MSHCLIQVNKHLMQDSDNKKIILNKSTSILLMNLFRNRIFYKSCHKLSELGNRTPTTDHFNY